MKKILQINVTANWGSTGRIAEEIGRSVASEGWESYIAYGRNCNDSDSHLIQVGATKDIYMHVLQTRLFDLHGLCSQKATNKLIENIISIAPDIIHLHNLHGYYLNYEILFKYLAGADIPIVWTLHDCWPFTGHCTHYSLAKCFKWEKQCNHCPNLNAYPKTLFFDRVRENFNLKKHLFTSLSRINIVSVSNWLARDISKSFLNQYPIKIIHNGVDVNTFRPLQSIKKKYGIEDKYVILGVASVWNDKKGLADFISLSSRIKSDERIMLVGLTPQQKSKLPSNIIGLIRTESIQQLAEIYSSADTFLNLTWEDNFPTTNLEALACGTPVITYHTGGSSEAICEDTGEAVPQGDIDEVLQAIKRFRNKGKIYFSHNCRERAINMFNNQDCYAEYIRLYKEILKK